MRDVLFTLSVKKKPFFIVLAMFTVVLVIAGIVLSVVLYKPWYNGKWSGGFSAKDCLSIIKKGEDLKILQISVVVSPGQSFSATTIRRVN